MAKSVLLKSDIDAGGTFSQVLTIFRFPIKVSAWLRTDAESGWQLYIATPDLETHGPIKVYKFLHTVYDQMPKELIKTLSKDDIIAANTTNHFVNAITETVGHPLAPGSYSRFVNCTLNGAHVDDMILYISNKNVKPTPKREKMPAAQVRRLINAKRRELALTHGPA